MKISNKNIDKVIESYEGSGIPLSKTWIKQNSKNKHANLDKLELAEGLHEFPLKSYKLEFKRRKFPFFNKNFLKAIVNKYRFNLKKYRFISMYNVYRVLNINFPKYNNKYHNFYYNFNGVSFNQNLSKFANFIEMQKKII